MTCCKDRIVIFGAGGFGREVYHLLSCFGEEKIIGFIAPKSKNSTSHLSIPILGDYRELDHIVKEDQIDSFIVAIGDTQIRKTCFERAISLNLKPVQLIHPSSVIFSEIKNLGCILYPNTTIMNDCEIGKGVLINCNASLGHNAVVGDFCNLNPGSRLAGNITIGSGTTIGIGAVVRENITIGKEVMVGAGSVVVKDIPDKKTVYGNPAK